ncbi:MAG: GNAT family N-acetyltransferase [Chroococcales cyanobacterium]
MIPNIIIRQEQPFDYSAIASINTLAFGREEEARLVERIRNSDRYAPEFALVAEHNHNVVGHILLSYVDLIGVETYSVLALAPLAVIPAFQRQGIGRLLVNSALSEAEKQEEPLVIVLGHPWFYPRCGFELSERFSIYCSFPVPPEAFMVKPLKNYDPKYQGSVVYPPSFPNVE